MKRRKFIKRSSSAITGLGLSSISSSQGQVFKNEQSIETYVTMDLEKVS